MGRSAGKHSPLAVLSLVVLVGGSNGAAAQPAPVLRDDASACDIAAELGIARSDCPAGSKGLVIGGLSRGLTIGGPDLTPPALGPAGGGTEAAAPGPAAIDATARMEGSAETAPRRAAFRIVFEFGSNSLTPESRAILDRVGTVLGSPGAERLRFQIIGHTDAAGSDAYNRTLSERRAKAVRDYIVQTHRIGAERMDALGRGEAELLVPDQPLAADNRRVEIVNLGS